MVINENIAKVICKIEYEIGNQCYNPNSYDGWTGDEGREYRYPVYIYPSTDAKDPIKVRGDVSNSYEYKYYDGEFTESNIRSMKYKFGSNHLFIGIGIINSLKLLEKRYGIDFNELENKYQNEQNNDA